MAASGADEEENSSVDPSTASDRWNARAGPMIGLLMGLGKTVAGAAAAAAEEQQLFDF